MPSPGIRSDSVPPSAAPYRPVAFLVVTVAWTGLLLGAAAIVGDHWMAWPAWPLTLAGLLGPAIVASTFVARGHADVRLRTFWRRAVDPRLVAWRWWLVVLAVAVVPPLLARLLLREPGEPLLATGIPWVFLVVGLLAGIVEEPAWRGYAQEGLQRRLPLLGAGLVIGSAWAAWHLPLFWLPGTYQHGLGVGTAAFVSFHLAIVFGSVFVAWLYDAAGGVAVAVVVHHAVGNLANEAFATEGDDLAGLFTAVALSLAVTLGAWRRMRERRPGRASAEHALGDRAEHLPDDHGVEQPDQHDR